MCRLWGSEVSGWGCPPITGAPCWPTPTAPGCPRPPPPPVSAFPLPPSPRLLPPWAPLPAGPRVLPLRVAAPGQKQLLLPLGRDVTSKQLCLELLLSVCPSPGLRPSRAKTYYLVGAGAGLRRMPRRHWSLSRVSGASILASSENQGLLSNPLSAGTWRSSFPVLVMRATGSKKSLSQMGSYSLFTAPDGMGLRPHFHFRKLRLREGSSLCRITQPRSLDGSSGAYLHLGQDHQVPLEAEGRARAGGRWGVEGW